MNTLGIGVISDTHQNLDYLNKVIKLFRQAQVELIIHLGDDYPDIDETAQGIKVIKVPGVYDPEYEIGSIPHRQVVELSGIKVLLTHSAQSHENDSRDDVAPLELARQEGAKLILYGHSHIPAIEEKEGLIWLNPGHLKLADKKGHPASYAVIIIEAGKLEIEITDLIKQTNILNYQKKF